MEKHQNMSDIYRSNMFRKRENRTTVDVTKITQPLGLIPKLILSNYI